MFTGNCSQDGPIGCGRTKSIPAQTITELPVRIRAPAIRFSTRFQAAGMLATRNETCEAASAGDWYRGRNVGAVGTNTGQTIAKLAIGV
jgi:hypothetical protein